MLDDRKVTAESFRVSHHYTCVNPAVTMVIKAFTLSTSLWWTLFHYFSFLLWNWPFVLRANLPEELKESNVELLEKRRSLSVCLHTLLSRNQQEDSAVTLYQISILSVKVKLKKVWKTENFSNWSEFKVEAQTESKAEKVWCMFFQ